MRRLGLLATDALLCLHGARIAIEYFGALDRQALASVIVSLSDSVALPVGRTLTTPSGGVLELSALASFATALGVGWLLVASEDARAGNLDTSKSVNSEKIGISDDTTAARDRSGSG